ncbi:autoinducer binding domain-containing protein [Burkholderia oklahomensis]|uniref:Bacterial regulatory s, luxR family protein n=1 Tax=Burkholderia oklahomensis TaxID=342113 RepID=A0AAI8BAT4_9BURK|nr:autoinducer binding domain-containing protein [Burkholderia oklahomensis]AIO68604.1 bacterial regulatory s, luxR family protein [Burkholderia oklahomensis]QPS40660.1 autoinducer binding domain-containing protein [Burkholderia oklahomensis]
MDLKLTDLLLSITQKSTSSEIFSSLEKYTRELGFDNFSYGFCHPIPFTKPRIVILSNYPERWRGRYSELGYVNIDPTVLHGRNSQSPFTWSELPTSDVRSFWDEANAHGLVVGWAKSILDSDGGLGMLTLARSNEELCGKELAAKNLRMCLLADLTHMVLSDAYRKEMTASADKLSAREVEILRWHADGKTADEIGRILSISIDTVKFHTKNAVVKLGASNKTAAVARAAIMGLLG